MKPDSDETRHACRELLEVLEQWVRDNTHHHQALQCYSYSEPYVDAGALMDRLRELRAR